MPAIAWKLLGGLVLIIGVAVGAYVKGHHDETLVFDNYKSTQAAKAEKQVASNQTAVAAITASEAAALRATNAQLTESNHEATVRHDALVTERDALLKRLRAYVASAGSGRPVVPVVAAGGQRPDAQGNAALPDGLAELFDFNTRQFYDADKLANQVTALQAVVEQDRAICNGALPGLN
jgi:hypothetical protein